jgi:hypothetical protein
MVAVASASANTSGAVMRRRLVLAVLASLPIPALSTVPWFAQSEGSASPVSRITLRVQDVGVCRRPLRARRLLASGRMIEL